MRKRRTLGLLITLLYDADPLIGWRAVEALGAACNRIAEDDPDCVREHLRRLYWLLSEESGGICWRAPEAMAEIVGRRPELFGDYIPIVVSLVLELAEEDLEHLKAATLWAVGRLGAVAGNYVEAVLPAITDALDDSRPLVRGLAVRCLGCVGETQHLRGRSHLLVDEASLDLYEDGLLQQTTVGLLARQALEDGAS